VLEDWAGSGLQGVERGKGRAQQGTIIAGAGPKGKKEKGMADYCLGWGWGEKETTDAALTNDFGILKREAWGGKSTAGVRA